MRRGGLSAALAAGIATACAVGTAVAAAQEPFYDPPSPLPAGKPGDLIRAEPMEARHPDGRLLPGRAWRVLYRSTSTNGRPTAVTGTVLVPDGEYASGARPLVGYSVGTRGIADRCAPSRTLATGREPEADTLQSLLERGWAVSLTDWEGFGTPGDHTYVVGRAEGQATLDAMRAARRLAGTGLSPAGPLALLGYSQGGHSAAWAAQVQPSYAPELRLAGAATGAVPSDLQRVADNVDGGHAAGLVLYAAVGMNAAYPELKLDSYLNDAGREAVARARDSCVLDGSLAFFAFRRSTDYATTDVRRLPDWEARLAENGVGGIAPDAPVFLYHARTDELVPYELSEELRARWCGKGVNVRFEEVPGGADHIVTGTSFGNPRAIDWLAERFAAGPPPQPPECPLATARLRFSFPGGARAHLKRRSWHVHAEVLDATLRGLRFTVRNERGHRVGRSEPRDLRGPAHVSIRLDRRLKAGARHTVIATGRQPDGSRIRKARAFRP
jgi:hypothetical protein